MDKRERLERTLAGEPTDRSPVALWRPFSGDDQRAADFAACVIDFQKRYDWDFVNIYPSASYQVTDYGVQDEWQGAADGTRVALRYAVRRSLDWTELRALDPQRGEIGKQLMAVKMVVDAFAGEQTPIVMTVYSPLSQAARIAGHEALLRHLRRSTERLTSGLNIITESTLRLIEALRPMGIAGIYYVIEYADYAQLSEAEYERFGLTHDLKVLGALPQAWWLNTLYLRGDAPMFGQLNALPSMAINWHAVTAEPTLNEAKLMLKSAACGGLDAEAHLRAGSPSLVRDVGREALKQMSHRRLILSAGGAVLATTPHSNLRAVRDAVEKG